MRPLERLRALRERTAAGPDAGVQRRLAELEREVQECRALNIRLAELTDVVTQLLLPVEARDEEQLQRLLDKYRREFT